MRLSAVLLLLMSVAAPALGADRPAPVLNGITGSLEWQNAPLDWKIDDGKTLSMTAGKQTDWFISPIDGARHANSPRLLFQPADDFVLSAKVTLPFDAQWDAGVLIVYVNEDQWAKLCFEKSVEGKPTIVSVVTRTYSDDNNHVPIPGNSVYLRIAKAGQVIVFYASQDGKKWSAFRAFTFGPDVKVRTGFSSQSPTGERSTAVFEDIRYEARRINIWTGE